MPGPQRNSTKLKVLAGNPGGRPLNQNEPQYPAEALVCPDWLNDVAKEEWQRAVQLLLAERVVTDADFMTLAAYCQSYARWRQAEEILEQGGFSTSQPVQNAKGEIIGTKETPRPEVVIAQKYQELMMRAAAKLGLDPSSRSKVSRLDAAKEDPFSEFLSAKKHAKG